MATLNRTFSVKNGIDVANTIIVDSSRNILNVVSANITQTVNAATVNVTTANIAETSRANVYLSTRTALSPPSLTGFNGERFRIYDFAEAGRPNYALGAESNHVWMGVDGNANTVGFKWYGNTSQAMRLSGNGVLEVANSVIANAFIVLGGLNITDQANNAYAQANAARLQANSARTVANDAYGQANAAANLVAVYANDSLIFANANVNFNNTGSINVAITANVTNKAANIAFDLNTASIISVGRPTAPLTLASNVSIDKDLTVTGNLYVLGNTTTVETETLVVEDSLIKLAANNTADVIDIGFFGVYDTTKQTGLFRDASDGGKYKLFTDYSGDLSSNLVGASVNSATLVANLEGALINVTTANIGTLYVTTDANVFGNLTVSGNTTYTNTVLFNAAVNVNSTLNVVGTTALTNANVNGLLTITAPAIGLLVANANVTYSLQVGTLNVTTNTVTTSSSGQVVLDKFPATQLASAKYFVQANSSSDYHTTEVVLVQDATNVWITEYGSIQTGPSLGTFSADISSGDVRLLFNATNNINTIRAVRYGIIP